MPGLSNKSYENRLKALKLPTLAYRRYRGDMLEMWKLTHGKYDEDVIEGFLDLQTSRARGHPYTVYKRALRKNLDVRTFSFKIRVRDQWNNLPEKVVMSDTADTFKNRLDKIWYGTDVYFNEKCKVHQVTSARSTFKHYKYRRAHLSNIDLMSEA